MSDIETATRNAAPPGRASLWGLAVVVALPELVLWAADQRIVGSPVWRSLAYGYGAFWPGLLHGWRPNFTLEPATMFLSYAFLHQSLLHLTGNLLGLIWLGERVMAEQGHRQFWAVLVTATVAGALLYALLAPSYQPMIGASGAVFGLAGALTPPFFGPHARPLAGLVWLGAILVLSSVTWPLDSDGLAWQAHLGGAAAGLCFALFGRRQSDRS